MDVLHVDAIPAELQALPQWVVWRLERRPGQDKPTKVPYNPGTGRKAASDDPNTWATFDEALTRYREGGYDGLGFVFTPQDPYCGVDLDAAISEAGELEPWAAKLVARFASYTELSPSGRGLHIIVRGKLPPGGRRRGKIEAYDGGRYFTMTGRRLPGTPAEIADRQAELEAWHAELFGTRREAPVHSHRTAGPFALADVEILERARKAENGWKFDRLWAGDWKGLGYPSQSEADLALCQMLAFWTGRDAHRIDRLFRQSGLFRPKWDERHAADGRTYGQMTIETAIARCTDVHTSGGRQGGEVWQTVVETAAAAGEPAVSWLAPEFNLTDLGNARRLVAQHGQDLRYCHPWGKWLAWDGRCWQVDATGEVERRAKETVRSIYAEAARATDEERRKELAKHAVRSESAARIAAMIDLARSEPGIPILPHQLDADPYLLGCLNGTLDLRTGTLRPHRREDFITKLVPVEYNPNAKCPLWHAFLWRIMDGNENLIRWLQKAVGYCLTADVSEHVLFILHGVGANGKSVFLRTLLNLLGPYGKPTDPDLLLARYGEAHPTGIADLMGARLAVTIETDEGRRMNETLVKWLTGGDKLKARFMRQDFFEFEPTFKLWIATNHKPMIRGTDDGIWRRLRLIPFAVTIPEHERDPKLIEKLKAELPGILRWAVEGCILWQQEGLGMPDEVRAATQAYRQEMDVLAQFLAECCVLEPNAKVFAKHLYPAYVKWCEENGERPLTQTAFGTRMAERGFEKVRWGPGWVYRGVGLLVNGVNGVNGSEPISPINAKRAASYTRDAENGFTNRSLFTTREAAAEVASAADGWEEGEI